MTIYRGPGGTGEARTDSDVTEVRIIADEAEGYKNDAAASASAAASSASAAATAETNAETAEANAETAEANAEAAQAAAEAAQAAAEAAQTAAEAAQTAAELAETNAETAEANAETAEANAETAQAAAATSATNAAASASTATTQASNAASSASTATTQAGIATTKASEAASSATAAQSAQTAAESARDSALSAYDNFDDRYLGPKSSDPTLDNDGNALLTGALYYDTTSSVMKVYTGSSWVAAYVSAAGVLLAANNLSDLVSASTARTNLGLGTAATTASTAYATAAQGTNADTAYGWGNHASAGYAADSAVVKLTGDQTVGGTKTFSSTITASVSGNAATATTATNLSGGTVSATSISDSGNLTFTGTGNRITGDFSNATVANRVLFQTSTVNANTALGVIPNGTATFSGVNVYQSSDPANSAVGDLSISGSGGFVRLRSLATGTGTLLPIIFDVGNSERMRVDTSGNVGIGTSSPNKSSSSTALTVNTGTAANYSAVEWSSGNTLNYHINANDSAIYHVAAGTRPWIVYTNGSERMRIDSSGNLGVGTSSPKTKLQSTAGTNLNAPSLGSATNAPLYFTNTDSAYGLLAGVSAGDGHAWFQAQRTDGTATAYNITLNEAGGNVGIGTSSPANKLHVSGNVTIANYGNIGATDNTAGVSISGGSAAGNGGQINLRGGSFSGNTAGIEFVTNNTERARIDSTGARSTVIPSGSTLYPAYDCRAWVNFNGTGTVAIRASGNVSSITDNGTGDYTMNFTTAMPDANYGFSGGGNASGTGSDARGPVITQHTTMSTSALRFYTNRNGDNGAGPVNLDYSIVCVAILR